MSEASQFTQGRQQKILSDFQSIFIKENIDIFLVYVDINSTISDSFTTAQLNIPFVHVEV